jgi:carboxyl-terminal processing protease
MHKRLPLHGVLIAVAAASALVLTVVKKNHEGVVGFSFESKPVFAQPGAPVQAKHNLTELKVFNLTLLRIKESYVEPQRIDPKEMLFQALDSVQLNIPEVLVESDPSRDSLTVVVNDKRETFSTSDVDSPWRLAGKLKKIFAFVQANMNPGADLAQVEYAAVNGMLETLDPHSVLMDPEAARELDVSVGGKFGGLGIVIRMVDRKLTVIRPIKNTPAFDAGIKAGDHIVKIDNQSTDVLTSDEAVDRMRGTPSTPVTLWVQRKGESSLLRFDITRALIAVESVQSKMLDKNVGIIKIKNFQGSTAAETETALNALKAEGARAIILDLRWNPGGLLDQAVEVGDLFVDEGTIVTTVKGGHRKPRRASRGEGETSLPVAVLVNSGSASASEIVAGALKNLDRAMIIGTRTFGKGSVQQLYRSEEDGTMLKLTVEQYLTPGDRSIQGVGIVPDVALQRMYVPEKNDSPSDVVRLLAPTRSWGEKDLDAHLTSTYAKDDDKPAYELSFLFEKPKTAAAAAATPGAPTPEEEEAAVDDDIVVDWETGLARDLIAGQTANTRPALVKAAKSIIAKKRAEEDKKLADALAKLSVDWSAPSGTEPAAKLTANVTMTPSGSVVPGSTVTLTGTVKNEGTGPAYRVHARAHADDQVFDDAELVFGKIPAGETRTFTTRVEIPKDAIARVDRISFDLKEARGATATVAPLEAAVQAAARPTFAYSHHLIDEGNGDGLLQRREKHRLQVMIKNTGSGTAPETTAILRNASGDGVQLASSRMEVGALAPGATKTIEFSFTVQPDLKPDEVVIELMIYDGQLGAQAGEKLKFPVLKTGGAVAAAGGVVEARSDIDAREGASADASVVARIKKGARFKRLGTIGPFTKIELDSTPAFVSSSSLSSTSGKPGNLPAVTFYQVTPPAVALDLKSFQTAGDKFTLTGVVNDETKVEDLQIFVSNSGAKIETRKVFYKSNRGAAKPGALPFSVDIPVWPGSNFITVVARENTDVRTMQSVVIFREPVKTAAAKP